MTAAGLTTGGPAVFDPFEAGFVDSPYQQYARLRAADPVHWSDLLEGWVLTRCDDVVRMLREPTMSVELRHAAPTAVVEQQRARQQSTGRSPDTLVLRDDPDHNRLRKLLQRPFGPRPVERLRALVGQRVDAAMDELVGQGTMDVIGDFAYPLPVGVFCEMLGLPDEDTDQVRAWIQAVARMLDPVIDDAEHARCSRLMNEMYAYMDGQIEARTRAPRDDVLTELVLAGGPDGGRGEGPAGGGARGWANRSELVAQIATLYVAGHEPTTALVGNGLLALLRQPDQLARLRERPELMSNAVHELLRYDGPNQFVRRIALEPLELRGRRIAPGDVLYLCIGAANRDPDRWEAPDEIRVERDDAAHHVQFGAGIHSCLGAHLARLQAEVALGALLARLDRIELAGDPVWSDRMVLRGLQSLPIAWTRP